MKEKHHSAFMKSAYAFADLSKCKRLKVGCVIAKDGAIISTGWNGMLPGVDDDTCEDANNTTKSDCIHAERNAINKLARSTSSGQGSTVFVTHCPCKVCATDIVSMEASTVIYAEEYRSTEGLDILTKNGIKVIKYTAVVPEFRLCMHEWIRWEDPANHTFYDQCCLCHEKRQVSLTASRSHW